MDKEDIESFRKPHESEREWSLRRKFLETHINSPEISRNRLICLSQCLVSIRCYGCRYPEPVMNEVERLSANIPNSSNLRVGVRPLPGVKFVKSSSCGSAGSDCKTEVSASGSRNGPMAAKSMINFVKESQQLQNPSTTATISAMTISYNEGLPATNDLSETVSEDHKPHNLSPYKQNLYNKYTTNNLRVSTENTFDNAHTSHNAHVTRPVPLPNVEHILKKFQSLANTLPQIPTNTYTNSISLIQQAANKLKMVIGSEISDVCCNGNFECCVIIDFVLASTGSAENKKKAKHVAFDNLVNLLQSPNLQIIAGTTKPGRLKLCSSGNAFDGRMASNRAGCKRKFNSVDQEESPSNKIPCQASDNFLSTFVMRLPLFMRDMMEGTEKPVDSGTDPGTGPSAASNLNETVSFNGRQLTYRYINGIGDEVTCQVHMNGVLIAEDVGISQPIAKQSACLKALHNLYSTCPTLYVKQLSFDECPDERAVNRDNVLVGNSRPEAGEAISDSNVGSKLLKKMGWAGQGGVGVPGNEGIAEPINLSAVINREGLGLAASRGTAKDLQNKITKVVLDYIHKDDEEDLVFAPTFTTDERAVIHRVARRYGLATRSRGKESERYLVLSRKRTPIQLLEHVRVNGGETYKYLLHEPSGS